MSWILFTIAAAILQTFRNLEQKNLNKKLDAFTVSWSRFILPLPFSIITIALTYSLANPHFIFYCVITSIFQISGNILLLQTVKSRNFSIGVVFYKTETLQAMILGLLLFHQKISFLGFIAIIIATIGMALMSDLDFKNGLKKFAKSLNKVALLGTLSGSCFAISAFSLKFASEVMVAAKLSNLEAAVTVLMWVIAFQNVFFITLKLQQKSLKKDLKNLFLSENKLSFFKTGILSFAGSICWFTAFTMGNVIYVKAVGQIELLLAIAISHLHLKEKHKSSEIIGIFLTSISILFLIFFH